MHHSLRFYSKHREKFLRSYLLLAKGTALPVIGKLVRAVANWYGGSSHNAYLLTLEEADEIIDASIKLSLGPCDCRKVSGNCEASLNTEIMVGLGTNAFTTERPQDYRGISKQEAKDILRDCHERQLIHTLVRCGEEFYAICNCCQCCCVPLRLKQDYGIDNALVRRKGIVEAFLKSPSLKATEAVERQR